MRAALGWRCGLRQVHRACWLLLRLLLTAAVTAQRLCGCCCWAAAALQWAAALQQVGTQGVSWHQAVRQAQQQGCAAAADGTPPSMTAAPWLLSGPLLLSHSRRIVLDMLGQGSRLNAGLSAAGYDMGPIVQGWEALTAGLPELVQIDGVPDAVVAERGGRLAKMLLSVGQALSVFAVPHCSNKPGCLNMSGLTEKGIVSGKSCMCSRCNVARYCGRQRQVAHWRAHKAVCKMLAAAAAGAGVN